LNNFNIAINYFFLSAFKKHFYIFVTPAFLLTQILDQTSFCRYPAMVTELQFICQTMEKNSNIKRVSLFGPLYYYYQLIHVVIRLLSDSKQVIN